MSRLADRPDPDLWREAVTIWDGIGFPYAAAYARFRGAEAMLAAGGDRDRVAADLRSSHNAATTLRAVPLTAAIERLARRARFDQGPRPTSGDSSAPSDGDGPVLTPRDQPADRRAAVHQREDGKRARVAPPGQAERRDPGRGCRHRPPPGPARRLGGRADKPASGH